MDTQNHIVGFHEWRVHTFLPVKHMRAVHTAKCDIFPSVVSLTRNLINIIVFRLRETTAGKCTHLHEVSVGALAACYRKA